MDPFGHFLQRTGALPQALIERLDIEEVTAALREQRLPPVPKGTLRAVVDAWVDFSDIDETLLEVATLPACAKVIGDRKDDTAILENLVRAIIDKGSVCGRAMRKDHPGLPAYAAHIDHVEFLKEASAHRLLALERGELDGVLKRELRWPDETAPPEWTLRLLPSAVFGTLHRRARSEATWAGAEVLIDLLTSPTKSGLLCGVARSGGKVGVVIVDRERVIHRNSDSIDKAEQLLRSALEEHEVSTLVAPTSGIEPSRFNLKRQIAVIRDVALFEAAKAFEGPRVEALAEALCERARDPRGAWGRLDPTKLGLVEYQQNIALDYARLVLRLACKEAEGRPTRVEAPKATGRFEARRLDDLKAGMMVEGTITQIAPFGAFANIGVGRDGLIHISELSEGRVEKPTDVVHVGQSVIARVLEVDVAERKISLSLRSSTSPRNRGGSKRKQAIDALDKLFK